MATVSPFRGYSLVERGWRGYRGFWNGSPPTAKKLTSEKLRGPIIVEHNEGKPIRTRDIPRGMNHRCPCKSGKKSRNCCRL